ncbi:MAG: SET domain-containing protein-lysine N-methyltransferase [Acidimicrobiales bacterium]
MGRSATAVLFAHGELRLLAARAFDAGEAIDYLQGDLCDERTRHSVEVGWARHLRAPADCAFEDHLERYWWRFVNHSCNPNTIVCGRELRAAVPIQPYEELCFDYETSEWELAEPFQCRCGSCDGRIVRGFRYLSPAERHARSVLLAPHLHERLGLL